MLRVATRAAQGGNAQSQFTLAGLYLEGNGVQRNLNNAGQLYSLAANQGHGGATFALAQLHGKGIGTEANLPKAWALATLADERGDKSAKAYATELEAKFDDKQKAAAKQELADIKSGKAPKPADKPTDKPADPKSKPTLPAPVNKP